MSENNTDLNEVFEEEMDDADVITVPIDETLSNSGEAADAAAVGAALALKADKDELPATIKVNNQPADNQGLILIDGTDIPVSDSNTKTLAEAIEEASEMTAATIPMTGETGAATIGETIGVLQETVEGIAGNMSADKIPMSEAEDAETIAEAIGIIADNVEELAETVEGMEQKTADKVLMETGSTVTVKDAIETLDRTAVKSVNRKLPDASGDVDLSVVPLAENLQSDKLQSIEGEFTLRTTGGTGSVSDGKAYPQHIYGNSRHDGFVAEVLNLTVIPIARTEPDEPITATIDRDTFLEEVEDSDTINLYYTTEWSEDPADYGVTVTGDPVAGDQITIVYVKEVRGTIVVAEPDRLVGTGWNLFNYNAGYARVVKYSETYGYKIGGTFTSIAFAASLTDDRISLLPNIDGLFSVPGDGYVFVTGGNNTDTYILTTWSDWIEGPSTGYWEAYRESGIDLSAVVETYFPYGMLKVGTVRDEIDLVAKRTISRIERMVYNEENRATAAATGRAYDFDENNIYVVRAEPVLNAITIDSEYSVSEHGLEWFTETELPLDTEILYGKNLRDKLERNVLTISAQTLTEEEKSQVRTNIGAMSQAEGDTKLVAPTEAGTAGQLLHLKEDGGTEWTTQGTPTDAQVGTAVSAWLDAHPEATTTVEDGAISRAKLNDDLKAKTDAVPDLKSAIDCIYIVNSDTLDLEQGNVNSSGNKTNSDTRLRTTSRIYVPCGFTVNVPSGFQIFIRYFQNNFGAEVGHAGWFTGSVNIQSHEGKYAWFIIGKTTDFSISPSDITTPIEISVCYPTDTTLTVSRKSADAKSTGDAIAYTNSNLESNIRKVNGTFETEFGTKNEILSGKIIYTFTEDDLEMIRSVTSSETLTFFGKNIFDQSTMIPEKIKNDSGQEIDDYQSSYFSQYIPCVEKKIKSNFKIQRIYRYDSSKNLIERTYWNSTNAYTIPSGTYFVQIQIENTQLTNTMAIWYGNVEPTYSNYQESNSLEDVFGEVNVVSNGTSAFSLTLGKLNQLDDIINQIAKETILEVFGTETTEETDYIITVPKDVLRKVTNIVSDDSVSFFGLNILDQSTEVFRHIKNDSGNVVEDYSSSYFSQFIPCHGKVISSNFPMQRVYLFDATKSFLRRTDTSKTRTSFTIPDDVYFIQIQIQNIDITDSLAINFGENTPTYSEYKASSYISDFDDGVNIISDGTSECTVELTIIKIPENEPHIIPAVGIYDMWEPSTVTDDYKCTPLGQATQSIPALNTLGWLGFLETYFDPYLGSYNDGYKVYREDFGLDSGAQATGNNASPVYSYVFEPKYYNKTVLLSAGMNTCEASTYFGLAYFIKVLMEHTEDGMEALYNTTRFVVMPVICPSGIAHDPLLYPNSNGVRINKNFEYYGSWARLHTELGGPSPDSEIETKILKAWLNKYNGATFWLDCHSDTATHATVKDLGWVYCSDSATANKLATDKQKIKDFYQNKGYFAPGDTVTLDFFAVGKAATIYPKTNYAKDVTNIPSAMMEQFEYSTAYGSDGNTNNDAYAIKHYVAMIRYMVLVMCESDAEIVS